MLDIITLHSNLCNITLVAIKVHVTWRTFTVSTWMSDKRGIVYCVTLWNNTKSTCAMLTLINMMTTWCVRAYDFNSLMVYFCCQNLWYLGRKCDNKGGRLKIENFLSLWIRDIREGVMLRRSTLQILECIKQPRDGLVLKKEVVIKILW